MLSTQELKKSAEMAFLGQHWEEAKALYQKLYDMEPENGKYSAILGEIHACLNDFDHGILYFLNALDLLKKQTPKDNEYIGKVYFLLALTCQQTGQFSESQKAFQCATKYCSQWKETWLKYGQFLFDRNEYQEAIRCFQHVVSLDPQDTSGWLTVGYLQQILKNHHAALAALKRAFELDPKSEMVNFYLAESLRKTGKDQEAIRYYESLLAQNPNHLQGLYGYGLSLLATGDLERGWMGYEARQLCCSGTWELHALPEWNGEKDVHGTILAYGEDGISSEIMFSSCLPDLMDKIGLCYVECNSSLHTLFKRSFPGITLFQPGSREIQSHEFPGVYMDYQVAFGSLPRHFRSKKSDFSRQKGFLIPDLKKVTSWKKRFAQKNEHKKIGILWEGAFSNESEQHSRIPLSVLMEILKTPDLGQIHWVSLQHGNHKKEWDQFCSECSVEIDHYPEIFTNDYDDLAAAISALDLVIAPSGFQAHLSAALGVPTLIALSGIGDWRWHLSENYSPWYPTARLFSLNQSGNTSLFIEQVQNVLKEEMYETQRNHDIIPFPKPSTCSHEQKAA